MQNQERQSKVNIGNKTKILKQELIKDKYIKTAIYIGSGVVGLYALGLLFKVINYTAYNYKILNRTLKS
jgi:hypothetical protein